MKIKNEDVLTSAHLRRIDTIWQMDIDEVSSLVDELWQYVPPEGDQDSIRGYFGEELDDAILGRYNEIHVEAERKLNSEVDVDGVTYKVVQYFDVYHLGWEMDTKAWVIEKDDGIALVHTNHGTPYIVEDGVAFLKAKVGELNGNVKSMKSAISNLELNG